MIQYLILNTLEEFTALNATFDSAFGYPTADKQTLTYAMPIAHPTNGTCAMVIQDRCLPYLSETQKSELIDYPAVLDAGFLKSNKAVATKVTARIARRQLLTPAFWQRNGWKIAGTAIAVGTAAAAATHFIWHLF